MLRSFGGLSFVRNGVNYAVAVTGSKPSGYARFISTSRVVKERSNYCPSYYYKMDSKHLAKGSVCPPMTGKVRIYSMRFCPFAQRAILVALAKGIPHDVVNCNLKEKPEWLFEKNPYGKVPVLELPGGGIIYESLVVSEFFDDAYEETRKLFSLDPFKKASDRVWIERFNKIIGAFYKIIFSSKTEDAEALQKFTTRFRDNMKEFDKELSQRGTHFFGGDEYPGMLDYMIWPWIERLPSIQTILPSEYAKGLHDLFEELPTLTGWQERMKEDFAVKEFILRKEIHTEFIESLLSGSPNYNILDASHKL